LKVHLHFYCVPNKNTQISADTKQLFVQEKLTKKPKDNCNYRKYSELYFHLVEYLYRTFSFKSRVSVYAILSQYFPIDELPRRIPSSNQLINTINTLGICYDGYPVFSSDNEYDEQHLNVIFLHSRPYLRFTHTSKASSPRIGSELDELILLNSIKLFVVGYQKHTRPQANERIALGKFYKENIELIKNIRLYAYFRERDITLGLLARTMSPFWLKASSGTNLEDQSDLINETFASVEPRGFKFTQHKSKKRIKRNDKAELVEITLSRSVKQPKMYAILLKHFEEGIYIPLLDSIAVSNFESDKSVKTKMQLHEWINFLNEVDVDDDWLLECKYTYKYGKYRQQYHKNEINIKTKGERVSPDANNNIEEKYTLNQKITLSPDYSVAAKEVHSRDVTPSPGQKKSDFPNYINSVYFTIDYKKPLKLNLSHLSINTKEELENLLNDWAEALDTFTDEDMKKVLFPPLKKPLTFGRLRRKNKPT